jgi:RimJ/RimL family protein N-acetyltransferase
MIAPTIELRPVTRADCQVLWKWVNQPSVRQASFSQEKIVWDQHIKWLDKKLNDDEIRMYIGILEGKPVGVVRYSLHGKSAEVSVNIDERFQGKGYGPMLIAAGSAEINESCGVKTIDAYVRNSNKASLLAFYIAGFERMGEVVIADQPARHLQRQIVSKTPNVFEITEGESTKNICEIDDI